MQKNIAAINRGVWLNHGFSEISLVSRLSYLYFLSSPVKSVSGFFRFPIKFISGDLSITDDEAINALSELTNSGFVEYDENAEVLFVPAVVENTVLKTKKHMIGFLKDLDSIPETPLLGSLKNVLNTLYPKMSSVYNEMFDNQASFPDVSLPEKPPIDIKEKRSSSNKAKCDKTSIDLAFDKFYDLYPRKAQRGYAREAFEKVLKKNKDVTAEDLVLSAQNFNEYCERNHRGVEYIPYPSSFLGRSQEYRDYLPKESSVLVETQSSAYDPSKPDSLDNLPPSDQLIDMFLQS